MRRSSSAAFLTDVKSERSSNRGLTFSTDFESRISLITALMFSKLRLAKIKSLGFCWKIARAASAPIPVGLTPVIITAPPSSVKIDEVAYFATSGDLPVLSVTPLARSAAAWSEVVCALNRPPETGLRANAEVAMSEVGLKLNLDMVMAVVWLWVYVGVPNCFTIVSFCSVHSLALIYKHNSRLIDMLEQLGTPRSRVHAYQYGVYFEAMDIRHKQRFSCSSLCFPGPD